VFRRCKYAVEENERLLNACTALTKNDLVEFGNFMYETHVGLKNDYEVSCKELDYLVELTKDIQSVYGARMMGGGFGGCTINLIENDSVDKVSEIVKKSYADKFGFEPKVYCTKINNGTEIINGY
jgi:galactokinase